ncbi:wntless-like 3 [Homarus americanus]|uniref:Protein wntless n=1 Tax=Homarus americanus TaxID=6706 RepID=A0A8J5K3Q8_HOMAM|nr:wntless-like 3 [Homarus americanus]
MLKLFLKCKQTVVALKELTLYLKQDMPDNATKRTSTVAFISLWTFATVIVAGVMFIGGEIAPTPWTQITVRGTKCVESPVNGWYFSEGKHSCLNDFDSTGIKTTSHADNIYYTFQWRLYGVLRLRLLLNDGHLSRHSNSLVLKSRLGYISDDDPYNPTLIDTNYQKRKLYCSFIEKHKFDGETYNCSPQVVFVLYSLYHDRYLINMMIPHHRDDTNEWINRNFGRVKDAYISFFSQAGWYTVMLVSLQTIFLPILAVVLWRFRKCVSDLERPPTHLECVLALLAVAITIMNCPLEFVALIVNYPWLIVVNDIRHNFFYASFMTFFLYLTDKHLKPGVSCPHAKEAINMSIRIGNLAILIVDIIEHIVIILHPLAVTFESMHFSMSMLFFSMLGCYLTCITVRTCSALTAIIKKGLVHEEETRCQEMVVLIITWICFFMTAADFIIKRLHDGMWMWDYRLGELEIKNTGGYQLGVYCMWNVFTCVLLVVYTPLRKPPQPQGSLEMARVVGVPLQTRQSPSFVDLRVTTL